MPKVNEQPGGEAPAGTGGEDPTATPTPKSAPTATVDPSKIDLPEGFELIKTEDKKNLISGRDKAKNSEGENSAILSALLQKDAIRDAMGSDEFSEKYPDVSESEILEADPSSDEEILEIAARKQKRYDKVKLDHLKKVQVAGVPTISASDKDTQLKELKKPSTKSRFSQALKLQRLQVK